MCFDEDFEIFSFINNKKHFMLHGYRFHLIKSELSRCDKNSYFVRNIVNIYIYIS